jgi:hypothetical protein
MKRWMLLFALAAPLAAQSTTITATITDTPDGQTWNNGTVTAAFVPGSAAPSSWTGGAIPNQVAGVMNGSGAFTISLPDNKTVTPSGSAWRFTLCPDATTGCVNATLPVTGASESLSAQLSAVAQSPRFAASVAAYGYLDSEIQPIPLAGAFYWNVTNAISRQWTGSAWQNFGTGAGGPPTGTAGGDLSGTYPNPGVAKINGGAVPASQSCLGSNGSSQLIDGTCPSGAAAGTVLGTFTTLSDPLQQSVDASGNVLLASGTSLVSISPSGVSTVLNSSLPYAAQCAVSDAAGNIWVCFENNNYIGEYTHAGVLVGSLITTCAGPDSIAFDQRGYAWVTCSSVSATSNLFVYNPTTSTSSTYSTTSGTPWNVVIDQSGNAWTDNYSTGTVSEINAQGQVMHTITVGTVPQVLGVDPAGYIWVPNGGTVTKINSNTGIAVCSAPSLTSYIAGIGIGGLAVDGSGNVWAYGTNSGFTLNGVFEINSTCNVIGNWSLGNHAAYASIDSQGNLWLTNYGDATILKIATGDRGQITPTVASLAALSFPLNNRVALAATNITPILTTTGCAVNVTGVCQVGTAGTTITLSGIPATGNTLRVLINGEDSNTSGEDMLWQFNGDTTTTDYDSGTWYGQWGTVFAAAHISAALHSCGISAVSTFQSSCEVIITGYANGTFAKMISATGVYCASGTCTNTSTTGQHQIYSGSWNSTAAISSISLTLVGGYNFVVGTQIEVILE